MYWIAGSGSRGSALRFAPPHFSTSSPPRSIVSPLPRSYESTTLKAGQQIVLEVAGEIDQAAADGQAVVHVAVQNELAVRAAFVGERQLARPAGAP